MSDVSPYIHHYPSLMYLLALKVQLMRKKPMNCWYWVVYWSFLPLSVLSLKWERNRIESNRIGIDNIQASRHSNRDLVLFVASILLNVEKRPFCDFLDHLIYTASSAFYFVLVENADLFWVLWMGKEQ